MKYCIALIIWFIIGIVWVIKLRYLDVSDYFKNTIVTETKAVNTGQLILDYLKLSPVKKIATYEVETEHSLIDDYFEDYKVLDFDTPEELDRLISQMTIAGKIKVKAVYGYTEEQIQTITNPELWWDAQLLYYEIVENNISEVAAGIGISNNALVKRVVNVVLQWIHTKLRDEFANNAEYTMKATQNAIEKFK